MHHSHPLRYGFLSPPFSTFLCPACGVGNIAFVLGPVEGLELKHFRSISYHHRYSTPSTVAVCVFLYILCVYSQAFPNIENSHRDTNTHTHTQTQTIAHMLQMRMHWTKAVLPPYRWDIKRHYLYYFPVCNRRRNERSTSPNAYGTQMFILCFVCVCLCVYLAGVCTIWVEMPFN